MKIKKILAIILIASNSLLASTSNSRFVESAELYRAFDDTITIKTTEIDDLIHFAIDRSGSGGYTNAFTPNNNWFIYPESKDRVWIHDGIGSLTLVRYSINGLTISEEINPEATLESIPPAVITRLNSKG